MSLAAKIRIDPNRWLLAGLLALGGGGCALALITIAARWRAGESVALLCALPGIAAFGVVWFFSRGHGRQKPVLLTVAEDGSVEYEVLERNADTATTPRAIDPSIRYRLSADSLFWPGFYVLRLDPVAPEPVNGRMHDKARIVSLIAFNASMPQASRRALARFLIWAQKKSAFVDRPLVDAPSNGDEVI